MYFFKLFFVILTFFNFFFFQTGLQRIVAQMVADGAQNDVLDAGTENLLQAWNLLDLSLSLSLSLPINILITSWPKNLPFALFS